MVSCIRDEIIGCIDINGDLVRAGYYILGRKQLRYCTVYGRKRWVKSELHGCFNGEYNLGIRDPLFTRLLQKGKIFCNSPVIRAKISGFFR